MYLVKAAAAAFHPTVFDGPNVAWSAGEVKRVDDNIVERLRAHSAVFTVVAGPDEGAIQQALSDELATDAIFTKNGASVAAAESQPVIHKTVLTCTATPISIADDAGVAQYGGVKIGDFPEGLISVLGCEIHGALTLGTTGTIINTFTGVIALGSAVAGTGATLTSTEADIMASNAIAAATAKVATIDGVSSSNVAPLDGTAAAKSVYLNVAIADDATHTAGTGSFTGTVTISWVKLGDN